MHDLRFAFRQLSKNIGFTFVAVLTLALGIGANTAIFSAVNAVLLKPLPYREPNRIMLIWVDNPSYNLGFHELPPSQRDMIDWRDQAKSFEGIAGVSSATIDLNRQDSIKRVGAVSATANLFSTLGVQPMLGRIFTAEEEQPGKDKVVIISYALWQSEFAGAQNLIGSPISLNNEPHIVVGIMAPGFSFPRSAEMPPPYGLPEKTDLWLPASGNAQYWQDDINRHFIVLGRLRPGVDIRHAQAEMTSLAERATRERPATHTGWITHLRELPIQVAGKTRPVLFVLLASVGFLLLIACANVANLLLCRSTARRKEMAIRAAIGAGRGRVIRQLLTESLLLAVLGGFFGLFLGMVALRVLIAASPPNIPRLHDAVFDSTVFGFSLLISLGTGFLFGSAPAWIVSKVNLSEALKASGRSNSAEGRGRRLGGLVPFEAALAVVLLVGAALMVQSFRRLSSVDAGFVKTGVCALELTFRGERFEKGESRIAFFAQMRERIEGLPGVRGVGAISHLPLSGHENVGYFFVEGAPEPPTGHEPLAEERFVTTGCLEAMGVSFVRGRGFGTEDGQGKTPVAIVNETLVHEFFPGREVLGKRIRPKEEKEWLTIVGVVRDLRGAGLDVTPRPAIYRHHRQNPGFWDEMTVVVRCADASVARLFEESLRHEIRAIDPTLPIANFRTMETLVSNSTARPRFSSFLLTVFAAIALILTMVGLYGVVAYSASQRTRELGIRLALGAQRSELLALVVKHGMRPALLGVGLGIAAAFGLTRFLASQLYEVNPTDPLTIISVSAILTVVALFACWIPARRAANVDPMVALRYE
jgi:putative ABC transport system permease protein